MALGSDQSYKSGARIYTKQQPDGVTLNGSAVVTERVNDAGSVVQDYGQRTVQGQVLPMTIAFTIAQGASSNIVTITMVQQDGAGNPVTNLPQIYDVQLSDDPFGSGLTATTASGTVSFTTGNVFTTYTAKKAFRVQVDDTGTMVLSITDTAKTGFYVFVDGLWIPYTSRQLVSGDYHP